MVVIQNDMLLDHRVDILPKNDKFWSESVCDINSWDLKVIHKRNESGHGFMMLYAALFDHFFVDSVRFWAAKWYCLCLAKNPGGLRCLVWPHAVVLPKTDGVFIAKAFFLHYHSLNKWIDLNLFHHFFAGEHVSLPRLSKTMYFHEPRQALYGAMSKHVDLGASAEDDARCFPRSKLWCSKVDVPKISKDFMFYLQKERFVSHFLLAKNCIWFGSWSAVFWLIGSRRVDRRGCNTADGQF